MELTDCPESQKTSYDDYLQRDTLETEGYVGVCRWFDIEMSEEDGMRLIEQIIHPENLKLACDRVTENKGAPGVDEMPYYELVPHLRKYYQPLKRKLRDGSYQPLPVKRVEIPKGDGSKRNLGIPSVRDRMVQQAILQVIEPVINPHFSDHSYGFRPRRNAKQAVKKVAQYYKEGYKVMVDCDLKSYFDTIHHQKLMNYLRQYIKDPVVMELIWKFLKSGVLDGDDFKPTTVGSPQGGNLSPLLSNVYLHELDKKLEERGHRFVRYADDFCIFVKSKRAAERTLRNVTKFLEDHLKLQVNREKSAVGSPTRRKFLGFCIHTSKKEVRCRPHHTAKKKFKSKIKYITRRNRPGTFKDIVKELNQVTVGWINYYGISFMKKFIRGIAEWLNHRLRQMIWKRWKKIKTRFQKLLALGIEEKEAWKLANTRKGYWRISRSETMHKAIKNKTLIKWGLKDITQLYERAYLTY